ncbi:UDP-glucose 4-epimerase GalE [Clostridium chromiireducens]|uniref:UDP-glucose 4-epimerase n=1 Tax=Clostridium chromiireducens TaxID=225345 RepID=A0A399IKE4_9CLOT|nr:UDP-glucose 4-epimerase GalE [Clostridium chromiireducens]RII32987.1 UDP-glucose 4-epimerase GalE [Clostridium chromiireducens]
MKVVVTGGAGYIGSTVCSALEDKGHTPIILDSLVRGREEFTKGKIFYKGDIADKSLLEKIFEENPDIQFTIHLAALVVVPESVEKPYEYYHENVTKSIELFKNLNDLGCKNIVFSSSGSIYDDVEGFMVSEDSSLNPRSPYARTKYMMEMVLEDFCEAYGMRGISLRYFNLIGADPKLRSGAHIKNPSHVLGALLNAASDKGNVFKITGTNWPTMDGSAIKDYIHVWDLALAHVKAIENFDRAFNLAGSQKSSYLVINLGTGTGVTVKELVASFENVIGKQINKENAERRLGDVSGAFARVSRAKELIKWEARYSLEDGIRDSLKWNEIRENIISF